MNDSHRTIVQQNIIILIKSMKFSWIFIIGVCWFASCTPNPDRLKQALEFAGENRGELQKVLRHYEDDTLKSRAARFLIENMTHCYIYRQGGDMDSVKRVRQAVISACLARKDKVRMSLSILPAFIIMVTGWTVTTLCVGK